MKEIIINNEYKFQISYEIIKKYPESLLFKTDNIFLDYPEYILSYLDSDYSPLTKKLFDIDLLIKTLSYLNIY